MLEQTKRTIETMKKAGFKRNEFRVRTPMRNGEYKATEITIYTRFNTERHSIKILVDGGLTVTKNILDTFTSYDVTYGYGGRYIVEDYREKNEYGLPKRTVAREYSEPQEAPTSEASEAPAIEATQKRVEDIEMVSIWSRMTIHERVAAITDLEVAVEQIKEVDVAGNTHPAYRVRVAPNTDHRVDVWETYIGRAETSDVRRGYAVFAGIESSAEEARERANALLAAADICDMLNMPIAD